MNEYSNDQDKVDTSNREIVLSIVIPTFNSGEFIQDCLESIQNQHSDKVEYILVDGGSTDSTLRIVQSYKFLFSRIISETDEGQSDAFNKGFRLAKGSYFTWFNSDDIIFPGAIEKLLAAIESQSSKWYTVNCAYIDSKGIILRCCRSGGFERFALRLGFLNVFAPSTIFHRSIYEEVGPFNKNFHFCMDTDYWWRIVRRGYKYVRVPIYFWGLRLHSGAKTSSAVTGGYSDRPPRMKEEGAIIKKLNYPWQSYFLRNIGLVLVRVYRVLNGSYLKAILDTKANRGFHYPHKLNNQ